jgi:hypothetical protein
VCTHRFSCSLEEEIISISFSVDSSNLVTFTTTVGSNRRIKGLGSDLIGTDWLDIGSTDSGSHIGRMSRCTNFQIDR